MARLYACIASSGEKSALLSVAEKFAYSIELAASPLTAFFIGPIAQFVFIPFMTTGRGVELIGSWFGVGAGRGIALVFILTGFIGLIVTLSVMHLQPYKLLAARYNEPANLEDEGKEK